jgi:predicted dithiol-disulfide oxidoreductase (DUF899 family)
MGNISFSDKDEKEARNAIKYLVELFKNKNIHEDHLIIYQFMIFYGTMFLDKKEALSLVAQMQDIFEPEKTLN